MSEDNILPEKETLILCDNCGCTDIYACMGVQSVYICRCCYVMIQNGELSIQMVEEVRNAKRNA